jgi:hypothetical protein
MHGVKNSLPDLQKPKDTDSFMGSWQLGLLSSMMNLTAGMDISKKGDTRQSENTAPNLENPPLAHGNDVGNTENEVASSKDDGGDDLGTYIL